jgi:hypothetical protein
MANFKYREMLLTLKLSGFVVHQINASHKHDSSVIADYCMDSNCVFVGVRRCK